METTRESDIGRFVSENRTKAVERRNNLLEAISFYESALIPLRRELQFVTQDIIESLTVNRYEPPRIARYSKDYGVTGTQLDYRPPTLAQQIRRLGQRVFQTR